MHQLLVQNCIYIGQGRVNGKLYEVDNYPALIESHNSQVYGELYQIVDREVLAKLDEYEECSPDFPKPHEYIRKILPIYLHEQIIEGWVYVYNWSLSELEEIESGDYLEYCSRVG